jgi:hypothetical protein
MKPVSRRKLEIMRFCSRLDRRCGRMNSGLTAVALVLGVATLLLSAVRVSDVLAHDDQLGRLPFIEMSTDGPSTGLWSMTD